MLFGIFLYVFKNKGIENPQPTQQPSQASMETSFEKISLQAKTNALKNATARKENRDLIIAQVENITQYQLIVTENYTIAYQEYKDQKNKSRYLILITSKNFETTRRDAENIFIKLLQLDKKTVCQLKIDITTPFWATPELSGKNYRPSFCE